MIKPRRLDHGRHPAPRSKRGSCLFGFGSSRFLVQSQSPGNFAGVVTVAKQTPDLMKSKAIKTTFGSRIALPASVPSGSRASQLPWRTISSLRREPRAQLATTADVKRRSHMMCRAYSQARCPSPSRPGGWIAARRTDSTLTQLDDVSQCQLFIKHSPRATAGTPSLNSVHDYSRYVWHFEPERRRFDERHWPWHPVVVRPG